jgi:acetyltransferase-like isoleucine patch superfamily enzyme
MINAIMTRKPPILPVIIRIRMSVNWMGDVSGNVFVGGVTSGVSLVGAGVTVGVGSWVGSGVGGGSSVGSGSGISATVPSGSLTV